MKAGVLHSYGTNPIYQDFETPQPQPAEVLITVKAAAIKQVDKSKASGKHYTSYPQLPIVPGVDGTGTLPDGTPIYALGITGMMAEKALVKDNNWVVLPDEIDFETAAALPNALVGSDMALLYKGKLQPGQTVLINGATGATGKIAVQMAKNRGAKKVIATGRNQAILEELKSLGADEIILLTQDDEAIIKQIQQLHTESPIDVVIDYLWGHPVELILTAIKSLPPHPLKIVTVGEMAGSTVNLTSGILRSTQIELLGSGIGSLSMQDIAKYLKTELPAIFKLVVDGKLKMDIEITDLKDIETSWAKTEQPGKSIVVKM